MEEAVVALGAGGADDGGGLRRERAGSPGEVVVEEHDHVDGPQFVDLVPGADLLGEGAHGVVEGPLLEVRLG